MTATTEPPPRIATLDIVRGVAVMGILAMNIVAFAMPPQAYINPLAYGAESCVDLAVYAFNFVFIDGKMRGLFSFLFGASMLLVIQLAARNGQSPAKVRRVLGKPRPMRVWYNAWESCSKGGVAAIPGATTNFGLQDPMGGNCVLRDSRLIFTAVNDISSVIVLVDLDGDSCPDAVVANAGSQPETVWLCTTAPP